MLIRANCAGRHRSGNLGAVLPELFDAVEELGTDPQRVSVTIDWVQYKHSFRPTVAARRFAGGEAAGLVGEIAIDLRRVGDTDLGPELRNALATLATTASAAAEDAAAEDHVVLERFGPPSASIIWAFNRCYWEHLSAWEATFKQDYAAALPGGVSDGTNPEFWRVQIGQFVDVLDGLRERSVLPEEIYVMELGVGSGQQARIWLDTFDAICRERGRDYYHRLQYLMTDYSRDVLRTARQTVEAHHDRVSVLNLDATNPLESLAFLRYKVLFIHSCNLYDNLPTDEVVRYHGEVYAVQARAYLDRARATEICEAHGVALADLPTAIARVLRIGPDAMGDEKAGVQFWSDVWDAVRLEESYSRIADPEDVHLAGTGVRLSDVAPGFPGETRVHLSTVALQSFANTLSLLHPQGMFQVQDIFVRDGTQYLSFRGPGKMDGSVVNWLNGPLFQDVAERLGFHIRLEPFAYRERSNTVVLTTSPKE